MSKRMLLITSLMIFLTSCGTVGVDKTTPKDVFNEPFSCDANIITPDLEANGTICRYDIGSWDIEFSEPSTLSGVTLSFDGVNSEASYKGLSFSMPKDAVPINSILLCLANAVDEISNSDEKSATAKDGILTFKGSTDCGDYILTVDEETGDIMNFQMNNLELVIAFSNVKPLDTSQNEDTTSMNDDTIETTTEETSEDT